MAKLKITLYKSTIGWAEKYRKTVKSLGLKRLNSSVIHEIDPGLMGKVRQIAPLIKTEEVK